MRRCLWQLELPLVLRGHLLELSEPLLREAKRGVHQTNALSGGKTRPSARDGDRARAKREAGAR